MRGKYPWSEDDIRTLQRMWREGYTSLDIGKAVNRSPSTVRQYVVNNRDNLGLHKRYAPQKTDYRNQSEFEKLWYGSVPFGHWSITKSWSKQQ